MSTPRKIEKVYVAPIKKFSFTVPELDEKGKKIPKTDPISGVHLRIDERPQYYERLLEFPNVINNVQKGCLSQYIVYKDTPQVVKDRLAVLCKDGSSSVTTKEEWIKIHNRPQWEEIQRREKLELELASRTEEVKKPLLETITAKDSQISELLNKVKELEKGNKQ